MEYKFQNGNDFALYEKLKKVLIIGLFLSDDEERFLLMECVQKVYF
jgi:hypothetical protein